MSYHRTKTVRFLGTHGVPANYGGFETAAENIARYLVARGWRVIVYCQAEGTGPIVEDVWNGIERVIIPVDLPSWRGTSRFDWLSIIHACQFRDMCLTFGYNTAIYNLRQRFLGIPNIINMDGIEWSRARWGALERTILYVNEKFALFLGDHLVADHPEIAKYLRKRVSGKRISTITYGADPLPYAPIEPLEALGLERRRYLTLIARPIPENSILDLIRAFSARQRNQKLVVLGNIVPDEDQYHRKIVNAASNEVCFAGPIYEKSAVQALRFHSTGYLHGHTVGGTNPSLVESMAAGSPVVAHDNKFNRWVAGDGALYFGSVESADEQISRLLEDRELRCRMRKSLLARFEREFTWEHVAAQYEQLLLSFVG